MEQVIIRDYQESDLDAVTMLTNQLGYPTTTEEMRVRMQQIVTCSNCRTLVAVTHQTVAGYIGLTKGLYWEKNGSFLRIQALVVHQNYRNAGIGRQLMAAAEQYALTIGASALLLNSGNRPERMAAHRFYPGLGFTPTSTGYVKKIRLS